MKKTIDKKAFQIIYTEKICELKSILECLVENFGKEFLYDIEEPSNEKKAISNSRERIYYDNKEVIYIPNIHNKKFFFPYIIKKSEEADLKFLDKNFGHKIYN
ncbi:hypothetical protein J4411_03955 [Candidatus Pacearchaeota archaeon]|nr:hypothetical protein [Candidatus Pacearchaeota archaeon]